MERLYHALMERHGPQGWWPLYEPAAGAVVYRPGDTSPPEPDRRAEIAVGAILTQNTSWSNVVRALARLHEADALEWEPLLDLHLEDLEQIIRPAGYFRQKARKLKAAAERLRGLRGTPARDALLHIWGVGPETADSILLYGYGEPVMVVDAYLRRLLTARGFTHEASLAYEALRAWIESEMPREPAVLNEFHALVVAEAKALRR